MRTWDLKEKFDRQDEQHNAVVARYEAAVVAAGTQLQDLKTQKDALIHDEFKTGADRSKEKAKLSAQIEAAEKALTAAEHERGQAYEYRRTMDDRISVRQLVLDWSDGFRSSVRSDELQPVLDRLTKARAAYYNALLDVKDLEAAYEPTFQQLRDMAYNDNVNHPGDYRSPLPIISNSDIPLITREDLLQIENYRKLPNGIDRTTGGAR
ncbi:hypothetical protein [Cohnella lupini]|uniref:Uncharacterized protein n=1 Tax=Cohnella lupini TaxID=1294267 RepID=A0A3D9HNS3_9BACL|nr:hypothetical protein [Cohnella lupini]RED51132.1 hypothetical protein DFP95_1473 [Cohnella lupini]